MPLRIVTDSTCDLPQHVVEQYGITVIPLYIHTATQDLLDGVDISRSEFYRRMPEFHPAPGTAAPGIDMVRGVYERLAGDGASQILSIHISVELSSMVDVARKAAQETRGAAVTVFDSRQLSLGTGYQAVRAAQAAEEGCNLQEILSILNEQIGRTHVFAALDTLEYLRRSGRMHFALATLGNLLQIKPFLQMYDGKPQAERVRTRRGARDRLVNLLNKFSPYERVGMLHADAAGRAKELLEDVRHLLPQEEVWFEDLNPVLGSHLGPGVIGFACISKQGMGGNG